MPRQWARRAIFAVPLRIKRLTQPPLQTRQRQNSLLLNCYVSVYYRQPETRLDVRMANIISLYLMLFTPLSCLDDCEKVPESTRLSWRTTDGSEQP